MMGHTHWIIGGASWLGVLAFAGTPSPAVAAGGFALASVAALCNDIDTKNSMASKALGPVTGLISFTIRKLFGGHRKITHSLLGWALVTLTLFGCVSSLHLIPWIAIAVIVGWSSHIAADMLTKEGCPLLWPISKTNYGLHLVTTGLDKKRGHHTSEWWVIRPLAVLAVIGFSLMLMIGG